MIVKSENVKIILPESDVVLFYSDMNGALLESSHLLAVVCIVRTKKLIVQRFQKCTYHPVMTIKIR